MMLREHEKATVGAYQAVLPRATLLLVGCLLAATLASVARGATEPPANKGAARLPRVQLEGNYFAQGGHRFLVTGAHWVPAVTGLQWPLQWKPQEIEADFARMAQMGFNTVRFDLFWAWFEPRPGDYNPEAFAQLDYLITLAHRYQIYLHPTLLVGGEVGEAYWDVPWRHGRDLIRVDPGAAVLLSALASCAPGEVFEASDLSSMRLRTLPSQLAQ